MRARRLIVGAAAALLLARAAPAPAQLVGKRRELGAIQKELDATRRELEEYRRLERSLDDDLQRLQSHNVEARRKLGRLKHRISDAEDRKRELRSRLTAVGQASGFWKAALISDLRAYAISLRAREAAGTETLWAESFRREAILEKNRLLGRLKGFGRKTELAEADTRRAAQKLQSQSQSLQQEQEAGQQRYQEKKAVLDEARGKRAAAEARARELEETARALTGLIKSLEKGSRRRKGEAVQAALDLPRNSLIWPANGEIIKPFGRQRNPELNTWVISQGILLATPPEAPVAAVSAGKVIFAGPFRSYGEVIIVDHGSGFFSVYGELGRALKGKGDPVKAGEVIARSGAPRPPATTGSLYLELRRGSEALDPLAWLRKR